MPAPKGHAPYPGCEKGATFGYLGRGENYFTDLQLKDLGEGLLVWIQEKHNIWLKYYFNRYGITWNTVQELYKRSEIFRTYLNLAKEMQEGKLTTEPYYHLHKADGNHARFMLARHHKGEWEDKPLIIKEEEIEGLNKSMALVDHLQSLSESKSVLKIDDSNINNAQ